jgi:hypothetical protein
VDLGAKAPCRIDFDAREPRELVRHQLRCHRDALHDIAVKRLALTGEEMEQAVTRRVSK